MGREYSKNTSNRMDPFRISVTGWRLIGHLSGVNNLMLLMLLLDRITCRDVIQIARRPWQALALESSVSELN